MFILAVLSLELIKASLLVRLQKIRGEKLKRNTIIARPDNIIT